MNLDEQCVKISDDGKDWELVPGLLFCQWHDLYQARLEIQLTERKIISKLVRAMREGTEFHMMMTAPDGRTFEFIVRVKERGTVGCADGVMYFDLLVTDRLIRIREDDKK